MKGKKKKLLEIKKIIYIIFVFLKVNLKDFFLIISIYLIIIFCFFFGFDIF